MPNDSHQRAAEFSRTDRTRTSRCRRATRKRSHLTGNELFKKAFEMSLKAQQASQFAHQKSQNAAKTSQSNFAI